MIIDRKRQYCFSKVRIQSTMCWAALIAIPAGIMAAVIKHGFFSDVIKINYDFYEDDAESVSVDSAVWSSYTTLVGFLIVFRTSQAYQRFWEGSHAITQMSVYWFEACAMFTSFAKSSEATVDQVSNMQHLMVRFFSLLHAVALGEVYERKYIDFDHPESFKFQLLGGPEILDGRSTKALWNSDCRVELIIQWIQDAAMLKQKEKILTTPPPILSRFFDTLSKGMAEFQCAIKVSYVPFPRPYSQIINVLLAVNWMLTPPILCQWTNTKFTAALFSFVHVFTLLALNFIAVEIEDPFGYDNNDIDGQYLQKMFNKQLRQIMDKDACRIPQLYQSEDDLMSTFRVTCNFRDLAELAEDARVGKMEAMLTDDFEELPNPGFRASAGVAPKSSAGMWGMFRSSNRSNSTTRSSRASIRMSNQDSDNFAAKISTDFPKLRPDLDMHRPPSPTSISSNASRASPSGVPPVVHTTSQEDTPPVLRTSPGKLHRHQESRLAPTGASGSRVLAGSALGGTQRQASDEIESLASTIDAACDAVHEAKSKISSLQESGPEVKQWMSHTGSMTTQVGGIKRIGEDGQVLEAEKIHPRLLGSGMSMPAGGDQEAPDSEKICPTPRVVTARKSVRQ